MFFPIRFIVRMSMVLYALDAGVAGELPPPAHVYEFDGSLPVGVVFDRPSSRPDATGQVVPAGQPRFQTNAFSTPIRRITDLPVSDRVIGVGEVEGVQYTVIAVSGRPVFTSGTPGLLPLPAMNLPHIGNFYKFGVNGQEWGSPTAAEVLPDGTILIHTANVGGTNRSGTVRTTISTFALLGGMSLVRLSDYEATPELGLARPVTWFIRTTWLPNTGLVASAISEYAALGLASTNFPGDGRSLGYASTDSGQTWTRVIDTDDPFLGRSMVPATKHLHHAEPFEWFDEATESWKVGVIGCLGDGPDMAGQIMGLFDGATFESSSSSPQWMRFKDIGADMMTDFFPLNSSLQPGEPLRFLQGTDTSQAGVIESSISEGVQTDRVLFRPTIAFPQRSALNLAAHPYVFQYGRLGNGCIVAPTTEIRGDVDPNAIWISDPSGEHWTTAWAGTDRSHWGFRAIGTNRFWTLEYDNANYVSVLYEVDPPVVRESLMLGARARDQAVPWMFSSTLNVAVIDTTGSSDLPSELPTTTETRRVYSDWVSVGARFDTAPAVAIAGQPGDIVQVSYWVRPAQKDVKIISYRVVLRFSLLQGGFVEAPYEDVRLDCNDWTRVNHVARVPEGAFAVVPRFTARQGATIEKPLNHEFTQPQVYVSDQMHVQTVMRLEATEADELSIPLVDFADEWTVSIDCTEAATFAVSLIDDDGDWVQAVSEPQPGFEAWRGARNRILVMTNKNGPLRAIAKSRTSDLFFPTQSRIALSMSQPGDRLTLYVARGLGEWDTAWSAEFPFVPSELKFASYDDKKSFEGLLHRVEVWPDQAVEFAPVDLTPPCAGDVDGNRKVDFNDVTYALLRLGAQGLPGDLDGDADGNGIVDLNDISFVILRIGVSCPIAP